MDENLIEKKSFEFAIAIVRACRKISQEKKEYVLTKQLLRSGTSIGANVAEAQHAQSKADFISKISIAQKEANETKYWIRLLNATQFMNKEMYDFLNAKVLELLRIISAIVKTASAR